MTERNIQLEHAGTVVVFDAMTGEVLHVHEKIVEIERGNSGKKCKVKNRECEEVRAQIAAECPGRRIDAVIAPRDMVPGPGEHYCVDALNRTVFLKKDCNATFGHRVAAG